MSTSKIQTGMIGEQVLVQRPVDQVPGETITAIVEARSAKDDAKAEALWPWDPATVRNVYLLAGEPEPVWYTVAMHGSGKLKNVPGYMIRCSVPR